MTETDPEAVSPDRRWRFADGLLRSRETVLQPYRRWNFDRWTFARFVGNDVLILGFETDYLWDDEFMDTTGNQFGGLMVLVLDSESDWHMIELDWDERHGDSFTPTAVVWHPRGVLAWLNDEKLAGRVLRGPRTFCDSEPQGLLYSEDHTLCRLEFGSDGPWDALYLSEDGVLLTVAGPTGFARLHLDEYRVSLNGRPWQDHPDPAEGSIWWWSADTSDDVPAADSKQ